MAPTYPLSKLSSAFWKPPLTTLYIISPFLVLLAFLPLWRYRNRNASPTLPLSEVETPKTILSSPDEHASAPGRARAISEPEIVNQTTSVPYSQSAYIPCRSGVKLQCSEHPNETSQIPMSASSISPTHSGGNAHSTLPQTSIASVPVAEHQQPLNSGENEMWEPPNFQGHQHIMHRPMMTHLQVRSETVQIFHGVGSEKGRTWKRRIIEYS